MGIHGNSEDDNQTGTEAPGIEQPAQTRAPGYKSENRLTSAISMVLGFSSLGPGIEDYIKAVKSYFAGETGAPLTGIDVVRLEHPNGAYAFVFNKAAIVLLFSEALHSDTLNFAPLSDYTGLAVDALVKRFGKETRFINALVVTPADYSRAQIMGQYISSSLAIAADIGNIDLSITVLSDNNYQVDPDVNQARAFIDKMNPSSIAPRADIGFVIYAKQQRRVQSSIYTNQPDDMIAIAAVVGYTEMLEGMDQMRAVKYTPMIHITGIASALPVPGMIALCMAVAADQFISTGRWLQPFQSFQKGKPNLGQLSRDSNDPKKLWFAPDPVALEEWRFKNCLPPVLAVDVSEGTARIPSLAVYGALTLQTRVYDQIQSFFGSRVALNRNIPPYFVAATEYTGTYGDAGGTLQDSRNLDYLSLLAAGGAQDASAQLLLGYPQEPSVRAKLISEKTGGTFRSLYRTTISVLEPTLLQQLAQITQSVILIEPPQGQNRMTRTDWMAATSAAYQSQNFNVSRSPNSPGGYNFGNLYSV